MNKKERQQKLSVQKANCDKFNLQLLSTKAPNTLFIRVQQRRYSIIVLEKDFRMKNPTLPGKKLQEIPTYVSVPQIKSTWVLIFT
jgi:hypothetical protein